MEDDIFDSLTDLGYEGAVMQEEAFTAALDGGAKSIEYTQVVEWLSAELKEVCKLDDQVNAITSPDDSSSFLLEVSSFLKEINCPYQGLVEGPVSQRLASKESKLQLIDFLCSELEAARMVATNKPDVSKHMQVEVEESSTAADLKKMLIALGFPKPPGNITAAQLFTKVEGKIKDLLSKVPPKLLSKPLFVGMLSDKQWHILECINEELHKEYYLRREMLLKRLDVTIQSFKWSDKAKKKEDQIANVFMPSRKLMSVDPKVVLADLLGAREDLAIIEKTSSASVRKNTQCAINKVMIGKVPDRGGRPSEQQAPPPEMPSWQKRNDGGGGGGMKRKYNDRGGFNSHQNQGKWKSGQRGRGRRW